MEELWVDVPGHPPWRARATTMPSSSGPAALAVSLSDGRNRGPRRPNGDQTVVWDPAKPGWRALGFPSREGQPMEEALGEGLPAMAGREPFREGLIRAVASLFGDPRSALLMLEVMGS